MYTPDGQVHYDFSDKESEYGRLMTLNSWYMSLLFNLLYVAASTADIEANLMLIVSLYTDQKLSSTFPTSRWVFSNLFLFGVLISFLVAVH